MLRLKNWFFACLVLFITFCLGADLAQAVWPSESLLPVETKGYVSIPDIDHLQDQFNASQWGQLMADPTMAPFLEDFNNQLQHKFADTTDRLGITWEDVQDVYGGEVCFAAIQPGGAVDAASVSAIVDVTGHLDEANALLDKIARNMQNRGATRSEQSLSGVSVVTYTLPLEQGESVARKALFILHENQLVAIDNEDLAIEIVARMVDESLPSLATLDAFQGAFAPVIESSQGRIPEIRWFIEPFGYAYVSRVLNGQPQRRGTDILRVLVNQGFTCIEGIAGHINFSTENEEILHRTMLYAPGEYELAARMLNFFNQGDLLPQSWATRELATYATFNWDMIDAFNHVGTLVDEFAGDEGFFEDLLESMATDVHGPRIDIESDLVAHLGDRVSVMTDYTLPITTECERVLVAIELTKYEEVKETINRLMQNDPQANMRTYLDNVIWEIVEEEENELPEFNFEAPSFGPSPGFEPPPAIEEEEERIISNAAVTVAHGHLIIATHVDFLVKVLDELEAGESLAEADDFLLVTNELQRLSTGSYAFRFFSRTDEEFRPSYELIRQGRMPESKTMLGKLLNFLFAPEDEDALREQAIDGTQLPPFDNIRRYLGPAGMTVRRIEAGWLFEGMVLTKMVGPLVEHDNPEIDTARADN